MGSDAREPRPESPSGAELEPPEDDPRVPRPEDAEPSRSKELGGAAPAVGPEPSP